MMRLFGRHRSSPARPSHAELTQQTEIARTDLMRFLVGDDVPMDASGVPCCVVALFDDLTPLSDGWADSEDGWREKNLHHHKINMITSAPFGTYAWRVRRLIKVAWSVH